MHCDVAIMGGGPAGSTLGSLLRRHAPELSVVILERELFPRDHVGESQLPHLTHVLVEMGVWDKVEAADFPVKIGGLYRWGSSNDLWSLDFIPGAKYDDIPRPSKYEGQRLMTAFQVDRSKYDKILLDHASELGCTVLEGVGVQAIRKDGDRILGFDVAATNDIGAAALGAENEITAKYYIDASGNTGMMRRTMNVEVDSPTTLRNVAVWDYWQNAEWAERIGVGGTRILVLSVGWGWIWFIPLSPTRTSVGLVTSAEYLKRTGKSPETLYMEAIEMEPTIAKLTAAGYRENILQVTRDWSFVANRLYGENWFLAGDSAGFADPILSAGLTLAQNGARKVAYSIVALEKGELDPDWVKAEFDRSHRSHIRNHIQFADYWYSSNGHFTELKAYCSEIARNAGIDLDPDDAFRWMGTGGFSSDKMGEALAGTFTIPAVKFNIYQMSGKVPTWEVEKFNSFRLDLEGAVLKDLAHYADGQIYCVQCYERGTHILPNLDASGAMLAALKRESDLEALMERFLYEARQRGLPGSGDQQYWGGLSILEALVAEGWVIGSVNPEGRRMKVVPQDYNFVFGWYQEGVGLASVNPRSNGQLTLDWEGYLDARRDVARR